MNTLDRLNALADVAESVGRLRAALPAEIDLSGLTDEVNKLTVFVVCHSMSATPRHPMASAPIQPAAPKAPKAPASRKAAKKEPKAPARAYVPGDKLGDPTGADKSAPAGTSNADAAKDLQRIGICMDCSVHYEKTGTNQKRCPACAKKRQNEQTAAWHARKRPDNPAATPDRLAQIKAADKRLDTIPE